MKTKFCPKCKKIKDVSEFSKCKKYACGLDWHCKACKKIYRAEHYDPDKKANYMLLQRYGIDLDDYNAMFKKQRGRCTICNRHQSEFSRRLNVDHDHKTGKVRSLLCARCNKALGYVNDDISWFEKALKYLNTMEAIIYYFFYYPRNCIFNFWG